ncbi:MAG: nucleotide sugar dehydrogenase [Thaumarchaeota archaeon]|nr:nucleotide sugar dehydrogenase [Nitrososphaerota archaeon]
MQKVCVIGLGYVGLPTACAFARSGVVTVGVDSKRDIVDGVNRGSSYLVEKGVADAVREEVARGRLSATSDVAKAVSDSDAVMIAVQTPHRDGTVVLDFLEAACEQVASSLRDGTVVIVESSVPPGTCERRILPIFGRHGKRDGTEFHFAYCPERVSPGNSLEEFVMNDRLIGADDEKSRDRALTVMKSAVKGKLFATDVITAETTKLVENAARFVYIAFANDLALISAKLGVDVQEVIKLANTHPRVKILNPGPGVGGPCLEKDSYLLLNGLGKGQKEGATIRTAASVNGGMLDEVLRLAGAGKELKEGSKVAVLGTSYKPGVGDPRNSPSEPVIKSLLKMGYRVSAYDPYCEEGFGAKLAGSVHSALEGAACAILLVAHDSFRVLDFGDAAGRMAPGPVIVDAAGITKATDVRSKSYRLRRLGDGRRLSPDDGRL